MTSDPNLLAALADAELLRYQLAHAEELLRVERGRANELADRMAMAESRLAAADERVRELHVLLLHRDQEIARLHGYLEAGLSGPTTREQAVDRRKLPAGSGTQQLRRIEDQLAAQIVTGVSRTLRWLQDVTASRGTTSQRK